jgi:hypothetical protein
MTQALSSKGSCAPAWQNPRSDGVCLPFFLVLFFGKQKKRTKELAEGTNHLKKQTSIIKFYSIRTNSLQLKY